MKVGDLVRGWYTLDVPGEEEKIGVVIEVINSRRTVPPVCKILWCSGEIEKEWTDDVEVING